MKADSRALTFNKYIPISLIMSLNSERRVTDAKEAVQSISKIFPLIRRQLKLPEFSSRNMMCTVFCTANSLAKVMEVRLRKK
jgi:hypothetical protein